MQITLKIILDELGYTCESYVKKGVNPSFECIELLASHGSDLSGQKLLICALSEALSVPNRTSGLYFLCIRDRMVDERETPETMAGIIIVERNLEVRELFNEVQRVFMRINKWLTDMHRSIAADEGIQALITMSEPIIGNSITVMDSTFKLLAYTKHVKTDEPVTNALIQRGYHPRETVEQLIQHRRLEQYKRTDEILIHKDFAISRYVTVHKIFRCRDGYSAVAVMNCCARPLSDGLIDLFKILMSNLQVYIDRYYPFQWEDGPIQSLICDILDQKAGGRGEIQDRAAYVGLSFQGDYTLSLLTFGDTHNLPLNLLIRSLSELWPGAHVLSYNQYILILQQHDKADTPAPNEWQSEIDHIVGDLMVACGVSAHFSSLLMLPDAYRQTFLVIQLGTRLKQCAAFTVLPDYKRFFYFEDYALFSQITSWISQFPDGAYNTFSYQSMLALRDYEQKHKVPYLRILHTYLQCERHATETCARLHMHRNTVLYHINRMEELIGASLDDPEVRLKLLIGFKFLELDEQDNSAPKLPSPSYFPNKKERRL